MSAFRPSRSENTRPRFRDRQLRLRRVLHDPKLQVMSGANYDRDPESCRATVFTQTDPLPLGAGSVFESSYVYGRNNPLRFVDPSGKRAKEPVAAPIVDSAPVCVDGACSAGPPAPKSPSRLVQLLDGLKRNVRVWGGCGGAEASGGLALEGAVCSLWDSSGGNGQFVSVGFGAGLSIGAGGGPFISNAKRVTDVVGWSACQAIGGGIAAGELCEYHTGGNAYLSFFGGLAVSPVSANIRAGGHITAVRTYQLPKFELPPNPVGGVRDAVKDGVYNGGEKTKSSVEQVCQMLGMCDR